MAIWRGIPREYKKRYSFNIWEQYQNNVTSAAYTSSLAKFVTNLCQKLNARPGVTDEERIIVQEILNSGQDKEILNTIRNETAVIVLMVRIKNTEMREEYQNENATI